MTLPQTMKAAVVHAYGAPLRIEEVKVPLPGPGQVLVKIEASGVCHTDLHAAEGDSWRRTGGGSCASSWKVGSGMAAPCAGGRRCWQVCRSGRRSASNEIFPPGAIGKSESARTQPPHSFLQRRQEHALRADVGRVVGQHRLAQLHHFVHQFQAGVPSRSRATNARRS